MDLTKGSCEVHAWRKEGRKEEEEEKNGPLIRLESDHMDSDVTSSC